MKKMKCCEYPGVLPLADLAENCLKFQASSYQLDKTLGWYLKHADFEITLSNFAFRYLNLKT
jgi:hypothetical protein